MPSDGGGAVGAILLYVLLVTVILLPHFGPRLYRWTAGIVEDVRDRKALRRPAGPRTGELVDDLRRLARLQVELPTGAPWARQHGTQLAYDDVLVRLCHGLEIKHDLATLPMGLTRDVERLRMEDVLYGLGLRIHTVGT